MALAAVSMQAHLQANPAMASAVPESARAALRVLNLAG